MIRMFIEDNNHSIDGNKAVEIELSEALNLTENLYSTNGKPFIGFVNSHDENIQFVRFDINYWVFDIPQYKKTKHGLRYTKSLNKEGLPTSKVKEIITKFFNEGEWTPFLELTHEEKIVAWDKLISNEIKGLDAESYALENNKNILWKNLDDILHIDGIPFLGGKDVLLSLYSDRLAISDKNKKNSYKIQIENIVDMKVKTETEISEQERHVLARAVAGGFLFGGVGAIVGAVSGVPGKQISFQKWRTKINDVFV